LLILIVDDDRVRASALQAEIAGSDFGDEVEIHSADCLNSAKNLLQKWHYDALILDVMLPRRSGETPIPKGGIELLEVVSRSKLYMKPERIIGITANSSSLERYRESFSQHCQVIVEARIGEAAWRKSIIQAISYTYSSRLKRSVNDEKFGLITVHGVQTFGAWQGRLARLVAEVVGPVSAHAYKYGIFSVLSLLIPPLRWIQIVILERKLCKLFDSDKDKSFAIYCHSFGTYLVVRALKRILKNREVPVHTVVLGGSILPMSFDFSAFNKAGIRVVNDCGDDDYVLYLSQAVVLGGGMAGKVGFFGFQDKLFKNRFFPGGHSHYFSGDDFMRKYWAPLASPGSTLRDLDKRPALSFQHLVTDRIIEFIGWIKPVTYIFGFFLFFRSAVAAFW
jgi:CheY-like chemotaxis protein